MHAPAPMYTSRELDESDVVIDVTCLGCGKVGRHRVSAATIASPDAAAGWDGFFTPSVLTCRSCGVEDRYEVTPLSKTVLLLRAMAAKETGRSSAVELGVAGLWDGTVAHRASQVLGHLRTHAEAWPDRAEGWRRLGNFCERGGRTQEALDHWTRAMSVDPREFEAVYSLAISGPARAGRPFAEEGLARFARIDDPTETECVMAEELARMVCAWGAGRSMLASWHGGSARGQAIVNMSSARLDRITKPERIVGFLLEEDVLVVTFGGTDVDDDAVTRLEARLGAPGAPSGFLPLERKSARGSSAPAASKPDRKREKKQRKAQEKARRASQKRR